MVLDVFMGIGKLLLRLVVGGLFFAHGMQKLTGAFGGPGLDGTTKMMQSQRLHPPRVQAALAALAETAGGGALILGLLTPAAAAAIDAVMVTAVRTVHFKNGLFNAQGGYEFNLTLAAAATALAIDGPGAISLDALFGRRRWGVLWGVLAAGAGVVGSTLAIEFGHEAARRAEATPSLSDASADGAEGDAVPDAQ